MFKFVKFEVSEFQIEIQRLALKIANFLFCVLEIYKFCIKIQINKSVSHGKQLGKQWHACTQHFKDLIEHCTILARF